MRPISKTVIAALALTASGFSFSHPATERYIPIGESPGVSNPAATFWSSGSGSWGVIPADDWNSKQ